MPLRMRATFTGDSESMGELPGTRTLRFLLHIPPGHLRSMPSSLVVSITIVLECYQWRDKCSEHFELGPCIHQLAEFLTRHGSVRALADV